MSKPKKPKAGEGVPMTYIHGVGAVTVADASKLALSLVNRMMDSDCPTMREMGRKRLATFLEQSAKAAAAKVGESTRQRDRASLPRTNPELEACIGRARRLPCKAEDQWLALRSLLEDDGFLVEETTTDKGTPAYRIDIDSRTVRLSFGTFQNRRKSPKSR